ncbi:MAG: chemoreceptor glutamine deamidase CheD [Minwuia sp.]|nr:chemoreceptor glutamine deamidase CheD [Minwuia sp.]
MTVPASQQRRERIKQVDDGHKRYFDPRFGKVSVRVLPGEHYVTGNPDEMIVTVLGSCISACIRDPETGIGGMNHFMLPTSDTGQWGDVSAAMRYGNYAMEVLINDLMRRGAIKQSLEIKIFGGGHVGVMNSDVGAKNIRFIKSYLSEEGFRPVAVDVGGAHPRRIHYFPATGVVKRLALKQIESTELSRQEQDYRSSIGGNDVSGDIELFD